MYKPRRLKRYNFKRLGAFALLLCMVVGLLPPLPRAYAADSNNYHYELDTDGIDPGATYLIVSGNSNGTAHALRMDAATLWQSSDQTVTVTDNKISAGFDNESTCQWVFSNSSRGTVTSNGQYLNIEQYTHYQSNSATMQFAHLGGGAYGIYLHGGPNTNLQYLCYGRTDQNPAAWRTAYNYGATGTDPNAYTIGRVYLFKQVESAYNIIYDLNRPSTEHDSFTVTGTLPENSTHQPDDSAYTVLAPSADLKVDTYNQSTPLLTTTYIFTGWNTDPNGLGTAYQPENTFTPTANVTLYAQWRQQTKYVVSAISYQDGVKTDFTKLPGCEGKTLYIKATNSAEHIPLTRTDEGTYLAYVTANDTYQVFASANGGSTFEPVYEHQVVIYNANGSTDIPYYSLTYDVNGGSWPNTAPEVSVHYTNSVLTVIPDIPSLDGYTFRGWSDGTTIYQPGASFPLTAKTTLTAVWDKMIDVTVNITVDHKGTSGGADNSDTKDDVTFQLLKVVNGVNQPYGAPVKLTQVDSISSNASSTTYKYIFSGLEPGDYTLSSSKSGYVVNISKSSSNTIDVVYTYTPTNFDLGFDVCVAQFNSVPANLRPSAINVKVTYWGYNSAGQLGWHTITQQAGSTPPTTVSIDPETGMGSGFYSVWQTWDNNTEPYYYRVEVTSFVLPDGSVVPAASNDSITYTSAQSGLYTANVSVTKPDGVSTLIPTFPPDSTTTTLDGAYYNGTTSAQIGRPVVTISVTPFTVTFDPANGTLNGTGDDLVLSNQYAYPNLNNYVPVPTDSTLQFSGWLVNGKPAENLAGSYLTGNVVYTANYTSGMTFSGTVTVDSTYEQDGQTVTINDSDRVKEVMVVLQKGSNGIFNDMASTIVTITYPTAPKIAPGTGTYQFTQVPDDGSEYRIQVRSLNYFSRYDNNDDDTYSPEEGLVITGIVDASLSHDPQSYSQPVYVDASRIGKNSRPNELIVRILYRDLGDNLPYTVISQHSVAPYGIPVSLSASGYANVSDSVWNFHNNGALYEYQAALYNASSDLPYTVEYGRPSYYVNGGASQYLQVTLIPKEYEIIFDLGNGVNPATVQGMDEFRVDANGNEHFAYIHTWSFEDTFSAFPYREGYVFTGWTCSDSGVSVVNHGNVTVGETLDHSVTLTATWEKLNDTDYTVRHLELNTEKVLLGAQTITNSKAGVSIAAAIHAQDIPGYDYVGAMIGGVYYDKSEDPKLTITNTPAANLITIYYLPDGSDGYTDQVESNLKLNKTATLTDDGTYTIQLETHTLDNPITTQILQNTPMDIVLVLDQSGSIMQSGYLDELKLAVSSFISMISNHGLQHKVEHRIAIVGYAGDADEKPTSTNTNDYPIAGGNTSTWVNTGVFDSNGAFHPYPVTGFNYSVYNGTPSVSDPYYVKDNGEYLLLTYHNEYYHLITAEEARTEAITGNKVFGYVNGSFVELECNTSGLWLYSGELLYSQEEFFTYHKDVWTHRSGLDSRQIHAYGTDYRIVDGHDKTVYTRTDVTSNPQHSIYKDALIPVSVGDKGTGGVNPGLAHASSHLGSNGGTFVQYGIKMANSIFAANPLGDNPEGRIRIMITFTDGMPGIGTFDPNEANAAIAEAYKTKNEHNVFSYAIGLYKSPSDDQTNFMNALSSNYPDAQNLSVMYQPVANGTLKTNGVYYVKHNGSFYQLNYSSSSSWWSGTSYKWSFNADNQSITVSTVQNPTVSNGKIDNQYEIYAPGAPDESPGYYSTTSSIEDLEAYFTRVVQQITTKITKEIVLHDDTIIRDIMGQGLVLTPGTVITAYKAPGTYNAQTGKIDWENVLTEVASVTIPESPDSTVYSPQKASITTNGATKEVPYISVYNLQSENPTNPNGANYHPHTIEVTGYDFEDWYIDDKHPNGYKMVVTITRVEARDDVVWGRATATNDSVSGLWLPADANGNRELLLPFQRPTTLFVERTYVLDYGKSFTLGNWYFDDSAAGTEDAQAIHVDCIIEDGMNWFNESAPNTANSTAANAEYGNTKYGNVKVENGEVIYTPVTTNWKGYDQFYVFGNTWRSTVVTQDANTNGNLWSKVTVIPANNVYFEDSFVSLENATINNVDGFIFSDGWQVLVDGASPNTNQEHAETQEATANSVHGWTDSLTDDRTFTDGSAHFTANTAGATASFTFTGTGVDVYTRTNSSSGLIVAILSKLVDGTETSVDGQVIDNLAVSGDYYHVPTISFKKLPYGTYTVKLIATAASNEATGEERYEYYLDGIRVYSPLGVDQRAADSVVKESYGLELNAVFTEVRDIMLHYEDFNTGISDGSDGKMGAVFIDWIREAQGSGNDKSGTGVPSYEIGTYTDLGPKNEVYLTAGQAVVIKVDPSQDNHYYIGLKSLTGAEVKANISGITLADAEQISISHTTDQYYKIAPLDGYIVIQNDPNSADILSVTKLRTTNLEAPVSNGGIVSIDGSLAPALNISDLIPMLQKAAAENIHAREASETQSSDQFASIRRWLKNT